MKRMLCTLVAFLILPAILPAADNEFFFKNGDRIVFVGDSITTLWTLS
jgi:hypothetical protein